MPSSIHSSPDEREKLRRSLRAARQALSGDYRHDAALIAANLLCSHRWYRGSRRIGFYSPVGSEFDTSALMLLARHDGKQLFLPSIVRPAVRLRFIHARPHAAYCVNRYGIPEPVSRTTRDFISARNLDLVLVPLLGFDASGNRLGTGAGYYDRSFDFKLRLTGRRPRLVGLAYDCQEVKKLAANSWDVPLDAVVTESRLVIFNP